MVLKLPRIGIAGMPLVDDERSGSRPEARDPVVQCAELLGEGTTTGGVGLQVSAEPRGRAPQAVLLAGTNIGLTIGQKIRPARRGYRGAAEERGQGGETTVDTIVVTAWNGGSAVVDQPAVRIAARVRAHEKPVAVPQRVLDGRLILRAFDSLEVSVAVPASVGGAGEGRIGVRCRQVVADGPKVARSQRRRA